MTQMYNVRLSVHVIIALDGLKVDGESYDSVVRKMLGIGPLVRAKRTVVNHKYPVYTLDVGESVVVPSDIGDERSAVYRGVMAAAKRRGWVFRTTHEAGGLKVERVK